MSEPDHLRDAPYLLREPAPRVGDRARRRGDLARTLEGIGRGGKEREETLEIRSLNNARAGRGRKGKAADLGFKVWDGKNSAGQKAGSGVYLAHIKAGSKTKIIKVAVER